MSVASRIASAVALFLLAASARGAEPPDIASPEQFDKFLRAHCVSCHRGSGAEAGLALDRLSPEKPTDRATLDRILRMVRSGQMPPDGEPKPSAEQTRPIVGWLEATIHKLDRQGPLDPGRVTIRRLNRVEYANTIRDLLGVPFDPADLPPDDTGYGFDNIADVLTLPPLLMEKYLATAEQIAARAIAEKKVLVPPIGASSETALRGAIEPLARRAFRRPATKDELDRLVSLATRAGSPGSLEPSVQLALEAILVSPQFLFRIEVDPPGKGPGVRLLNDYELASRLSYFLWSSMPDDPLFEAAARGQLRTGVEQQVRRMLADGKSQALVASFCGQWLELRNLERVHPDRRMFPGFNDDLRRAMRTETEMLFGHVLREDRPVLDFLTADYTFVNEPLARLYGMTGVTGSEFRRVPLSGPRGGVLSHASVLTITSNPTRTSAVKRGKWVLDNLLGEPPPSPPANVPQLPEDKRAADAASLRERLEQHRSNPNCAVCHVKMDALGFALENFDPVGAWRTRDGKFAIDASGKLPDGRTFNGPAELRTILAADKDIFVHCLAEKMLTYATGRGLEPADRRAVEGIVRETAAGNYRFSSLILAIVKSDPFQKRRY